MWSPNEKVWSPKWENEESNFWHIYSFTKSDGYVNMVTSIFSFTSASWDVWWTTDQGFALGPH